MAKREPFIDLSPCITREQYRRWKTRQREVAAYWDKHATVSRGGWRSLTAEQTAREPKLTNERKARIEQYDFAYGDAGARGYFGYWQMTPDPSGKPTIGTWTGKPVALVTWAGGNYRLPAFWNPSTRKNFNALGIDGNCYAGTFFVSAGSYVRMRRMAEGRRSRLYVRDQPMTYCDHLKRAYRERLQKLACQAPQEVPFPFERAKFAI